MRLHCSRSIRLWPRLPSHRSKSTVNPEEIRKFGAAQAPNPNLPPLIEELTERELEVVAGVARGLTNQGIGSSLGVSVETVKTQVVNANDKFGCR